MILVDANVLVALVDSDDGLHRAAKSTLPSLKKERLGVTSAVLVECTFLLQEPHERRRLADLLEDLAMVPVELEPPWWREVFEWLAVYAEHAPDLADAQLVVLCSRDGHHKVWSFDHEFKDVWRMPNGKPVPLLRAERTTRP